MIKKIREFFDVSIKEVLIWGFIFIVLLVILAVVLMPTIAYVKYIFS
jgi:hypothetical protein